MAIPRPWLRVVWRLERTLSQFLGGGDANHAPAASSGITQVVYGINLSGQPGIITTVAAVGASFMATDTANNLYFCGGGVVSEMSAATGIITTVAGNGGSDYSGDNGQATNAGLTCQGLALDSAGDIYILDTARIRKVTAATGIITTVAGGGSSAFCEYGGLAANAAILPRSIGVDAVGNLYFVNNDYEENYELCTVNAGTGIISSLGDATEPSGSDAGFPDSLAVDASGNAYLFTYSGIAGLGQPPDEYYGYPGGVIYKVSSASGNPRSIVAGVVGTPGHTGDGGPAINAEVSPLGGTTDAAGNLYFYDSNDNDIRKINASTGIISVVASRGGPGTGCLQQTDSIGDGCLSVDAPPDSYVAGLLAVDGNGNIFTSDGTTQSRSNAVIRGISALYPTEVQPSAISDCAETALLSLPYGTNAACSVTLPAGANGTVSFAYDSFSTNAVTYLPSVPIVSGGASEPLQISTLPVGIYHINVTYSGNDTYAPSFTRSFIGIVPATPTVHWPAVGSISYGTALSAQQLNASSSVPGVLTYTPGPGTVLPAGSHTLQVSFSPTDTSDYTSPVTMSQTLLVTPVSPSVTWPNPSPIEYGTPLSSSQLNATATVAGTFAYSYQVGTILPTGLQTIYVTFTPTSSDYAQITTSVQIEVNADTPNITGILPNPAVIGATVTIVGQNFGPSQGSSTLAFNGVAAVATSWTDNSIVTTVPAGATTGDVVVNVGAVASNGFLLMIPKSCP